MQPFQLSVIIPAFNSEAYINKAIISCALLTDCQVIVVDDGSSDRTASVAKNLGARVLSQANAGAAMARRKGLSVANSKYVVFLDADDELVASGVLHSISLLDANNELSVAAGTVMGIWPSGSQGLLPRLYSEVTPSSLLKHGFGPWPPAAAVFRRNSLIAADDLSIHALSTRFAEDYELIIRLSLVGKVAMHDSLSTNYRLYVGKSSTAPLLAMRDKEAIKRYYAGKLGIESQFMSESEMVSAAHRRASRSAFANGNLLIATREAFASFIASPCSSIRKFNSKYISNITPNKDS